MREEPGKPLTQTLVECPKPKKLLLLLDNCEHLLSACATLTNLLLCGCPGVRLLATSREGLNIPGETPYRLASLSVPDPGQWSMFDGRGLMPDTATRWPSAISHQPSTIDHQPPDLMQYEAVQLFVDRATTVAPSFTVTKANAPAVAQVCHRLDGIPLAIELAAARVKALPVEKINERLDDRFRLLTGGSRTALPRQQTLRALIDWSYDLLTEEERALLRRLSVFAGGFALEAAEAVCAEGAGIGDWGLGVGARADRTGETDTDLSASPTPNPQPLTPNDFLDLLAALVEKSLVLYEEQAGEARYWLLETVRQYCRDRLLEAGEAASVRSRHRAFYLQLAEPDGAKLPPAERQALLAQLELEHDNLRAALAWCRSEGDIEVQVRLTQALLPLWWRRGYLGEARVYLSDLLSRIDGEPTALRARVLGWAGGPAQYQGDFAAARGFYDESLAIYRRLDNKKAIASSLHSLGAVARHQRDYTAARSFLEEALSIRRELGETPSIALELYWLGLVARAEGDAARERALLEESRSIYESLSHRWGIAWSGLGLGLLAYRQGDLVWARSLLRASLQLFQESDDTLGFAWSLERFAGLAAMEGRAGRAARLFGAAERLREVIGVPLPPSDRSENYDDDVVSARSLIEEAPFAAAWAEGRAMTLEQAVSYALEQSADD